jgi:hypothetical protein
MHFSSIGRLTVLELFELFISASDWDFDESLSVERVNYGIVFLSALPLPID